MTTRRPRPARGRAKRRRGTRSVGKRVRRWVLLGGAGAFLLLFAWIGVLYALARIPEPNDISRAQSVTVVDRDGKPVGRIHAEADRVSIPLKEMPEHLREAVIATEDRRFYKHAGVSIPSIVRAAFANLVGRGVRQGGSTITQQYVKNAFVGNERSFFRKSKEAVLALKLERQRTKDEILELYLNTIYFGRGAYGVEAAAQTYFGKKARDLTLAQGALLAGIIQAPEGYEPARDPDAARGRRNIVLGFMVRDGFITQAQADRAKRTKIRVRNRRSGGIAPHFLEDVREHLEDEIGPAALYAGDVTVTATLDVDMQRAAEEAVRSVYDRRSDPEAALVAVDPETGAVRAMVGARDYRRRQLNIASRARRQPGSTFKPMVLAAAIEDEVPTTKTYPAPATKTFETDSGPWKVSTYDRRSRGTLSLARATELSVNTVYAQLVLDVGPAKVVDMAKRLGITSKLAGVPSLALGTSEVSPLELSSAYATLAARGTHREPYLVAKVTARGGRVLFSARPEEERTVDREVADRTNAVLQGVIRRGTGQGAQIGRPAAGKTGTTEDFNDAWFAGYTPDLAAVVWNGFPQGGRKLRDVRGINVTGGSFPAQMWSRFMRAALEGVPPTPFEEPPPEDKSPSPSPSGSRSPSPSPSATPSTIPSQTVPPTPKPSQTNGPKPKPSASDSPSPSPTGSGETT